MNLSFGSIISFQADRADYSAGAVSQDLYYLIAPEQL